MTGGSGKLRRDLQYARRRIAPSEPPADREPGGVRWPVVARKALVAASGVVCAIVAEEQFVPVTLQEFPRMAFVALQIVEA